MYLIYGESYQLIADEIKKIIPNDSNVITMDLAILSLADVITEASYVSLFAEKKYIIVKNADIFGSGKEKENEINLLLNYIDHPIQESTIIFCTYNKIDSRKKITKIFKEKFKIIALDNLSNDAILDKALEYVKSNKFKISKEILQYILNACQNHYDLIYNELNKLFLYYGKPEEIKESDVLAIVSQNMEDNNFKFVEAVVTKKISTAVKILADLTALKVDAISLLMLLAREYRLMYSATFLYSNGYRKNQICQELELRDWQVDKLLKSANLYDLSNMAFYLKTLAQYDYQIKSGKLDKDLALKEFLMLVVA